MSRLVAQGTEVDFKTSLGTHMNMTREIGETFAAQWAEAWNRRALEAVLEHFHEDVVFSSPTALAVVGSPMVRGRDALRAYWTVALARITSLLFTVDHVVWDPLRRELAIIYTSDIDGQSTRVSENLTFDEHGQVVAAEVSMAARLSANVGPARKWIKMTRNHRSRCWVKWHFESTICPK